MVKKKKIQSTLNENSTDFVLFFTPWHLKSINPLILDFTVLDFQILDSATRFFFWFAFLFKYFFFTFQTRTILKLTTIVLFGEIETQVTITRTVAAHQKSLLLN